jgi:hypothetical protein
MLFSFMQEVEYTVFCSWLKVLSDSFKAYVAQRDYKLHTVADYGQLLTNVGFQNVSDLKGKLQC